MNIKIAGLVNDSITDGVGIRFVVFVQGCPHRCDGCHNQHTQDFAGGSYMEDGEILEKIKNNPLLDGVTLSGGEPFAQAEKLLWLAKEIKKLNLHLVIYTGYVFENLKEIQGAYELLKYADVLVDGPFVKNLRDYTLKFKGSSNQRIIDVQKTLQSGKVELVTDEKWN